jgi:tetratricopeptide (TPR) repeat protein
MDRPAANRSGGIFVGRSAELRELEAALEEALSARGSLVLIRGEPGAGKTTLARRFASAARDRGVGVAWASAAESEPTPPFWPWTQILRSVLDERDVDAALPPRGTRDRQFLEAVLGFRPLPSSPLGEGPGDAAQVRWLLFDAVARWLSRQSRIRPLVLVLDDLQDADRPSLALLRFFADRISGEPVLALGLVRDLPSGAGRPTDAAIRDLALRASTVVLGPFSDADVRSLYAARVGRSPGEVLVRNIAWASGGNPFFVDEMVRAIAAQGEAYALFAPGQLPLTERAREAIHRRLGSLSEEARAALEAASVLGHAFGSELLSRVLGWPRAATVERLAELCAVHLLEADPAGTGGYRFSHALLREALYSDLHPLERAALHRRAAEALERDDAGSSGAHLGEVARHWWEARAAGVDPPRVRRALVRAAEAAAARLAWEEASHFYERAIAIDGGEDPTERADILLALGDARWRCGDLAAARRSFEEAAETARRLGDARRFAEAALGCGAGLGSPYVSPGPDPKLVALLEEAIRRLPPGDDPLRVRCLSRLAVALHRSGAPAERRAALAEEAVAMAGRLGDPSLRLTAAFSRHWALLGLDTLPERHRAADEIAELAESTGNPELAYWGQYFRLNAALESGDFPAVARSLERCEGLARSLPLPLLQWRTATLRAMRAILEGQLEQAEAQATLARELGTPAGSEIISVAYAAQIFVVRWLQGRLREIESDVRSLAERSADSRGWRAALAWLYAETGRSADARAEFERLLALDPVSGAPDGSWGVRVFLAALAADRLGEARSVEPLYRALLPFADRHLVSGGVLVNWGSASVALGLLARCLGQLDAADGHFHSGYEANTRLGNRPFMALAALERAALRLRRSRPGDRNEADRLSKEARHLVEAHGFTGLLPRLEALERELDQAPPRLARDAERVLRREGDYWTIRFEGTSIRLRDSKGLRYLAHLLSQPGIPVHVLDLVAQGAGSDGPSPALPAGLERIDARARRELRSRAAELEEEIADAEAKGDRGRVEAARRELEFLAKELASAYGLGGRPRRASDPAERARKAVSERIRTTVARIERENAALARYLSRSVRTGTFCVFTPERDETWTV